jgi:hypothetical protein
MSLIRSRWAAVGAAIAVTLGAGGIGIVGATVSSGERATFVPITPCRLFDTRPGTDNVGTKSSPLGPGETYTVGVHGDNGQCSGIPADAVAVSLNATALNSTSPTFVTVFAADAPRPVASSLNPVPGGPPIPNGIVSDLSATGFVSFYNANGSVDLLADVIGYYVDHNHDDRYVRLPETEDVIDPASWQQPTNAASGWTFVFAWAHTASGSPECLFAPVHVPEGRTITRLVANYVATGVANPIQMSIAGVRNGSGPLAGFGHVPTPAIPDLVAPITGAGTVGELAAAVPAGYSVQPGFSYSVRFCADDAIIMTGFEVEFS